MLIPRFSFIKLFRDMFLISCLHKNNYENNLFCFYERIIKKRDVYFDFHIIVNDAIKILFMMSLMCSYL